MITHDLKWSLPPGNPPVPCCWQATKLLPRMISVPGRPISRSHCQKVSGTSLLGYAARCRGVVRDAAA
jgi:hypothetical protein